MVLPPPPPYVGNSIDAAAILAEYSVPPPFDIGNLYSIRPQIQSSGQIALSNFYGVNSFSIYIAYNTYGNTTVEADFTMIQAGFFQGNVYSNSSVYVDSVGNRLVDTAELYVGGQLIERLTGEFIQVEEDLTVSYENQTALNVLLGKSDTTVGVASRTYLVNLPFYFYKRPELSLPLVALNRQDVEVHVNFTPISQLQSTITQVPTYYDATILADIAYLAQDEMKFYRENRLDYIITQLQKSSAVIPAGLNEILYQTYFVNPVSEMYFLVQNGTFQYANAIQELQLYYNGQLAFADQGVVLGVIEPLYKHTCAPTSNVYVKSFALQPEASDPSTYVNMSRIKQQSTLTKLLM
ncbi:hypothetical protein EBT31_02845, partial [bacterium]|nr:hypothetical protein [bacterium]